MVLEARAEAHLAFVFVRRAAGPLYDRYVLYSTEYSLLKIETRTGHTESLKYVRRMSDHTYVLFCTLLLLWSADRTCVATISPTS